MTNVIGTPWNNRDEPPPVSENWFLSKRQVSQNKILGKEGDLVLIEHNRGSLLTGVWSDDGEKLMIALDIQKRTTPWPATPTGLKNPFQVRFSSATSGYVERGFGRRSYLLILKHFDLISDHEHFETAIGLWKAVAREVKVYIWTGKDYLRNDQGSVVLLDEHNTHLAWSHCSREFHNVLLVATESTIK